MSGSSRERLVLAADGFLIAGAADIALTSVAVAVMYLAFGGPEAGMGALGPAGEFATTLLTVVLPVFLGAVLAWTMHGNRLRWADVAAMFAGLLVGGFLSGVVFFALAQLLRLVPTGLEGPPWLMIGVLLLVAAALTAVPLIEAVRDLRSPEVRHPHLDTVRVASVAIIVVLGGVVLPWAGAATGTEIGEAGLFMVPMAMAGAAAVLGADLVDSWRARRHGMTDIADR